LHLQIEPELSNIANWLNLPLKRGDSDGSDNEMSIDINTVKKIANLSRIAITDAEAGAMVPELNGILKWVEQLSEVDVTGVVPMASVIAKQSVLREDAITDGDIRDKVLANAPAKEGSFFGVPKVIE
jgi:aspartyl-tRNA(Asn)/glutamyl-tRNA(Gln) amidotransferase subunit C